ncbi:hypothetical protein MTsDn1_22110 [Alteromonas sp. MTD1]|uniref:tetratricopeptide repeat protein n=1 Tax=Alteromonas sp. MTD1 TaxID=3057962 RepID=UPI0036F25DF9
MALSKYLLVPLLFSLSACNSPDLNEINQRLDRAFQKKEYAEAEISLKQAIADFPNDNMLRLKLAEAYVMQGNTEGAEKEALKILELVEDDVLLKRAFNVLTLSASITRDTSTIAQISNIELCSLCDFVFALDDNYSVKSTTVETALELYNSADTSPENLAKHLEKAKYPTETLIFFSDIELKRRNIDQAFIIQEYIVAKNPNFYQLKLRLAHLHIFANQFVEANLYVEQVIQKYNKNPLANYIKGKILFSEEKYAESLVYFQKASNYGINLSDAFIAKGISEFKLNKLETALLSFQQALRINKNDPIALKLISATHAKLGNTKELLETLYSSETLDEADILNIVSAAVKEFGVFDAALKMQALAKKERNESLRDALNDASKHISSIVEGNINLELTGDSEHSKLLKLLAIHSMVSKSQYNKAIEQIDTSLELFNLSDSLYMLELKAALLLQQDKPLEAALVYEKILSFDAVNQSALLFFADEAMSKNETQNAFAKVDKILSDNPLNLTALRRRVKFSYMTKSGIDKTLEALSKAIKNSTNKVQYELLKSGFLLSQGLISESKALFTSIDTNIAKELNHYWEIAFALDIRDGNDVEATFNEWKKIKTKVAQPYLRYSKYLISQENTEKAIEVLEDAVDTPIESKDDIAILLFGIYFNSEKLAPAENLLKKARLSDWLPVTTLDFIEAEFAVKKQDFITAERLLRAVYSKTRSHNTLLFLSKVKKALGQSSKVELISHFNEYKTDYDVAIELGNSMINSEPEEAIRYFDEVLKDVPSNILALNNKAWTLYTINSLEEAKNQITYALNLAPNDPFLLNTFAHICFKQDEHVELQDLDVSNLDDETKVLVAASYYKTGNRQKAINIIKNVNSKNLSPYTLEVHSFIK